MIPQKHMEVLIDDIYCEYKTYDSGFPFFHNHDGYEFYLLLKGNVNYYVEEQGYQLSRGSLICVKPYVFHRRSIPEPGNYDRIIINIKDSMMPQLSTTLTDLTTCFNHPIMIPLDEEDITLLLSYGRELEKALKRTDYGSDLIAEAYVKLILVMINKKAEGSKDLKPINIMPPLVSDTIAYIEKHIQEEITLEILSKHFHHNGTYISRCFKKITGLTLQDYLIRKRISLAKKYLLENISPGDCCDLVGFKDYSNFCRSFTKHVGMSPRKFQKNSL